MQSKGPVTNDPTRATSDQDIASYIAGDDPAGGRLCRRLEPVVRAEVRRFLPASDLEHDDVVQETLLGFLAYLRRAGRSPDRPEAFVVTMAGNRCRNLYRWRKRRPAVDLDSATEHLAADVEDPLAMIEAGELEMLLAAALRRLDSGCRRLLSAIYTEDRPMADLQRESGLGTVQGVYYRKYACLRKLARLLNEAESRGREREPGSPVGRQQGIEAESHE